jgi:hypothetical protein
MKITDQAAAGLYAGLVEAAGRCIEMILSGCDTLKAASKYRDMITARASCCPFGPDRPLLSPPFIAEPNSACQDEWRARLSGDSWLGAGADPELSPNLGDGKDQAAAA